MTSTKSKQSVAAYLTHLIDYSDLKQFEIADIMGYDKPNMITMIKQGKTKLPINKIGAISKALKVDPVHLLRMVMQEYLPETWEAMEEIVGKSLVTDPEIKILKLVREGAGSHQLALSSSKHRADIVKLIKDIADEEKRLVTGKKT